MRKLSFSLEQNLRSALLNAGYDKSLPETALAGIMTFLQGQGCEIVITDQVAEELRIYLEPQLRTRPRSGPPSLY
jgi:hypothetical protein